MPFLQLNYTYLQSQALVILPALGCRACVINFLVEYDVLRGSGILVPLATLSDLRFYEDAYRSVYSLLRESTRLFEPGELVGLEELVAVKHTRGRHVFPRGYTRKVTGEEVEKAFSYLDFPEESCHFAYFPLACPVGMRAGMKVIDFGYWSSNCVGCFNELVDYFVVKE